MTLSLAAGVTNLNTNEPDEGHVFVGMMASVLPRPALTNMCAQGALVTIDDQYAGVALDINSPEKIALPPPNSSLDLVLWYH